MPGNTSANQRNCWSRAHTSTFHSQPHVCAHTGNIHAVQPHKHRLGGKMYWLQMMVSNALNLLAQGFAIHNRPCLCSSTCRHPTFSPKSALEGWVNPRTDLAGAHREKGLSIAQAKTLALTFKALHSKAYFKHNFNGDRGANGPYGPQRRPL